MAEEYMLAKKREKNIEKAKHARVFFRFANLFIFRNTYFVPFQNLPVMAIVQIYKKYFSECTGMTRLF